MLVIEDLHFAYGEHVFHYNLSLPRGEVLALLGTSGAGKTSLLNLLAGFEDSVSGLAEFDGVSLLDKVPQDRPISMIFQDHNLFMHLSVGDNVALGNFGADREEILQSLSRVGLADFANRFPSSLSGGQISRVALARALLRDKPLLLLDEAFTALHPALRFEMLDLLDNLRVEKKLTVILVTHLPDEALRIADKVAFIENGEILISGDAHELLTNPPVGALSRYLGL